MEYDNRKTLYLVDTYNLIFRAFFSFAQKPLVTSYNMNVSAIYGFMNMLLKVMSDFEPTMIACACDTGEKTFRDEIFEDYKANRPECPDELVPQFAPIFEFIDALSIKRLLKTGLEADDIIGTAAAAAEREGYFVRIISSDRDLFQLVSDRVKIIFLKKGISEVAEFGRDDIHRDFSIFPEQVAEYKALVGDPSDNIPGIRGIGPKAAAELLTKYRTIEGIYANLPRIGGRRQLLLEEGRQSAEMSLKLATIRRDADIPIDFSELARFEPDIDRIRDLCVKYEQKKIFEKLNKYLEKRSEFFYGNS